MWNMHETATTSFRLMVLYFNVSLFRCYQCSFMLMISLHRTLISSWLNAMTFLQPKFALRSWPWGDVHAHPALSENLAQDENVGRGIFLQRLGHLGQAEEFHRCWWHFEERGTLMKGANPCIAWFWDIYRVYPQQLGRQEKPGFSLFQAQQVPSIHG